MGSDKATLLYQLVALAMTTELLASDVGAQVSFGSVLLFNAEGANVLVSQCKGPDGDHLGPFSINSPKSQRFQFQANVWSVGWRCKFQYVNGAEGNRMYTADVLVWQGFYGQSSNINPANASLLFSVPYMNCIWRIQRDGFYRADYSNPESFRLQARWV